MQKMIWIGIGLVAWLGAQIIAFAMTGGGHGTYPPLIFSLLLIVLYPAACLHAFVPSHQRKGHRRRQVLAAALPLNILLLAWIIVEGGNFVRMWKFDPLLVTMWIVLWLGWQALFLPSLHGRQNHDAHGLGTANQS